MIISKKNEVYLVLDDLDPSTKQELTEFFTFEVPGAKFMPQFKNRMENIVFAFKSLKEGLDTEKRAMQRIWNKREKEIEKVIDNTAGLYGDMQGIIGGNLPRIELLELTE